MRTSSFPSEKPKRSAFTIVELILVIFIIAMLAGLLMPALATAKQRARTIQCSGNLRQIAMAMISYAHDNNDALPPLNSGGPWRHPVTPHNPTNWWFRVLSNEQYLPHIDTGERGLGVWRCPNARVEPLGTTNINAWGSHPQGYGPNENTNYVRGNTSIIFWGMKGDGSPEGSARLGGIQRQSQLWLVGDVGVPVDPANLDLARNPYDQGYYKSTVASVTFPPNDQGIYDGNPEKQPALRHKLQANVAFVDGHVESWNYRNLAFNTNDIWGIRSR